MQDPAVLKIFHFARFDVTALKQGLGIHCRPILPPGSPRGWSAPSADRHGLQDLCKDLLGIELSKQQQSSDWGAAALTPEQLRYAASDVLHLHALAHEARGDAGARGAQRIGPILLACPPGRSSIWAAGTSPTFLPTKSFAGLLNCRSQGGARSATALRTSSQRRRPIGCRARPRSRRAEGLKARPRAWMPASTGRWSRRLRWSGRVVVTGMGKSGLVARKIAATLASTGTPALFVHPCR